MGSLTKCFILLSVIGSSAAIYRNVTSILGNRVVNFPLLSGEINGRMVIVDSRQVNGRCRKKCMPQISHTLLQCSGQRVKLACVNWYGFHFEDMVINGLDRDAIH